MQTVTTIGLDIAKSVFQVHGVDAAGQVVIRHQLKRRTSGVLREAGTAWSASRLVLLSSMANITHIIDDEITS